MTDRELELWLRDYFRAEAGDAPASRDLLVRISSIPDAAPVVSLSRRVWLLAAAVLLLVAALAAATAVGSGVLPRFPLLGFAVPTPSPAASATASPTASASPLPTPAVTTAQIDIGGQARNYTVLVPPDVAARGPLPLLLALHGGNVTQAQARATSGFDALAIEPGAVVVFPEGYQNSWNAGTCCKPATTQAIDDVAFISALIDQLEADYAIDPNQVFITGDGTGGSMAYRAACELSDRIDVVAVISGPLLVDCSPSRPISALHVHGTADTLFLYDGGGTACDGPCPAVAQTMDLWRQADGCTGAPTTTTEGILVTTTNSTCSGGVEVELIAANGLDTTWGAQSAGLDDTAVLWTFLKGHIRSGPSG
jgi:polyhydroxybutyrate depolymerase